MSIQATITLTFTVVDEERLRSLAEAAIAAHGGGYDTDGTTADLIVELLLHSNPDIRAYLDYGIELVRTETRDTHLGDSAAEDGRHLRVRFTPQAWMNDHAVEVDAEGPVEWDVSPVGIDALQSSGNPDLSDALAYEPWFEGDPATPAWIRAWTGPFHIQVVDTNLPHFTAASR